MTKKPKRKTTARERTCQGCGRVFSTPQGLGQHFTAVRKRTGRGCGGGR